MSNNRDFARKRMSCGDIVEYYSDNLVIFTESSEERWEIWAKENPITAEILTKMFGTNASYLLSEISPEFGMDQEIRRLVASTKVKSVSPAPVPPERRVIYVGEDS